MKRGEAFLCLRELVRNNSRVNKEQEAGSQKPESRELVLLRIGRDRRLFTRHLENSFVMLNPIVLASGSWLLAPKEKRGDN